ncbi:MAG: TonB-dependent receptor, partial [Gammaproteobacteria bacterium]|nr:TonB-dependent receptor [Gammaproteobacteria bacterium]
MRPRSAPPVLTALAALSAIAVAEPKPPAERLEEVKITATPLRRGEFETAQPVLVVAGDELLRRRTTTLADTLATSPGLSATSFGPIASRPVIRGQGGLRVQVFQDGADVLDAAALSEDHAVTLDPLLAERVEVVRGPAALMFGNAASAGAVNVVTRRIPTEPLAKAFTAAAELRGDSAADTRAVGAHAAARNFGLEAQAGHVAAQALVVGDVPVLDQVPGGRQRRGVVQDAGPQGGQGADPAPRAAVGA